MLTNSYVTAPFTKGVCFPVLNCYACPLAAVACPIGSLQHFSAIHVFPFYTIGILGLVGSVVGRMTCGWICPFGFLQDLMYKIPSFKIKMPKFFNYLKYVFLVGLVIMAPYITGEPWFSKLCPAGVLEAGIPLALLDEQIRRQVGTMFYMKIGILLAFLASFAFIKRPFCRAVCPLGAILSFFNSFSAYRMEIDGTQCIKCNKCQNKCPVDIKIYENPNSTSCIRCLECTDCACVSMKNIFKGPVEERKPLAEEIA
jgi:ferredoxin-type protein NapH